MAATPTTSACPSRPMPIFCAAVRAWPDQVDQHRRRQEDEGRAGDLYRRRPEKTYGTIQSALPFKSRDGSDMKKPGRAMLPTDKVRFVGDPIACVVAETVLQAKDAAEADRARHRAAARGGRLHPRPTPMALRRSIEDIPDNVALDYHYGDTEKVAAAFASAAHKVKLEDSELRVWSSTRWSPAPRSANTTRPGTAIRCIRSARA